MNTQFDKQVSSYSDIINVDSLISMKKKHTFSTKHTNVQINNWVANNHNISISYTPENNIYFDILCCSSLKKYDGFVKSDNLDIDLDMFYNIVVKTFNSVDYKQDVDNEKNKTNCNLYKLLWSFDSKCLRLTFSSLFDGFFSINQTVELKEVIITGDDVLTYKLTNIEVKYQNEISILKKNIEDLQNEEIILAYIPDQFGKILKYSKNSEILDFASHSEYTYIQNNINLNFLKNVNTIIINISQLYTNNPALSKSYVPGIFNNRAIYLPSVNEIIIICNIDYPIPVSLYCLPNLNSLTFKNFTSMGLKPFDLIKNTIKLKKIVFCNSDNIDQLDEIKKFCKSTKIELEIL